MKSKIKIHISLVTLIFSSIACSIFIGGPEYPEQVSPTSATDAQSLKDIIQQAMTNGAETGIINLQITEAQLTAFIADQLAQQTNPPFTEPQILLRNGQMQLYGKLERGWLQANMLITMNVSIDPATGKPSIQIASADFGPIPAPEGINSAISSIIDEAFTGSFGPVAVGFRLETITIADSLMTLTGRIK
ncbi:MAG TPA: hypothetical protein PK078_03925 [Anaerolineales bacterium]|nr:hypothetical protein [Anaerolineales bacterium]